MENLLHKLPAGVFMNIFTSMFTGTNKELFTIHAKNVIKSYIKYFGMWLQDPSGWICKGIDFIYFI